MRLLSFALQCLYNDFNDLVGQVLSTTLSITRKVCVGPKYAQFKREFEK